jgi:16S rRNA A1518/A1519 N6-dimethyltransferase RsmA/KsgA/DIM1 with predicted DNA glycosylase/AP lyase activity
LARFVMSQSAAADAHDPSRVLTNIRSMVDALDPEGNEIRVLNSLCRLRARTVLEIGAGNGRLTWRYAERVASVVALEPDAGRVARAKASTTAALRDRVDFRHADVAAVSLPDAAFDVVLFSWSI